MPPMRSFGETLPTLRVTGAASRAAPREQDGAFEPDAILKALNGARGSSGPAAPALGKLSARRAFSADTLPRKSETRFGSRPFQTNLEAAIQSFDTPRDTGPARQPADDEMDRIRREATAERERAVEAARAQEREKADERLHAERARWAEETADKLSADIDRAFVELHNRLADAIALALTPVLEEAMRIKAVNRFSASLERLMGRNGGTEPVTVRGPRALLDALEAARAGDTAGLKLVAADESELVASVNETTLRTTIKAWATALAAASGTRHG